MTKNKILAGGRGSRTEPGILMGEGDKPSDFHAIVADAYGSFLGPSIAANAERQLREAGIEPRRLVRLPKRGANTILFSLDDKLIVKVNNQIETYGREGVGDNPVILKPYLASNIGFDMGNASVALEVFPQLNTRGVTAQHVSALCHELHTKYGLVFRDNALENVGLTREGVPYVIDSGSVISKAELGPLERERPFFHPELSGFNAETNRWDSDAVNHGFTWPPSQQNIPEFIAAGRLMNTQTAAAGVTM